MSVNEVVATRQLVLSHFLLTRLTKHWNKHWKYSALQEFNAIGKEDQSHCLLFQIMNIKYVMARFIKDEN